MRSAFSASGAQARAIVGVILNLAAFFAYHVLWPQGVSGPFDWFAAPIGLAAFLALFRFKMGIIPLVGACAVIGIIHSLVD